MNYLYEILTDPLGLPIHPLLEYLILFLIDAIAYRFAFKKVGEMYSDDLIVSRDEGSFFHWLIRLIIFLFWWAVARLVIFICNSIIAYWQLAIGIVIATAAVIVLTIIVWLLIKKNNHIASV